MLIGLAAAGIPVLLHLLNLRKLKTVKFSTLRFLKELQKTRIKRFKIKQIILLILRTLIIVFAALAFARPTVESSLPFAEEYAGTSAVILIDNSFSMEISDEFGERRKQALNSAKNILNTLKEGDEAAILPMSETVNPNTLRFSKNLTFLQSRLAEIKTSYEPANLERSLRYASVLMQDAGNLNREVYVISDAQQNIIDDLNVDSTKIFQKNLNFYFIKTGAESERDIKNISIDSVNVITKIFEQGKPIEAEVFIKNHSEDDYNDLVLSLLYNGKRTAQRNVSIPAGEIRTVSISAPPQTSGLVTAKLELEKDALEPDNERHFAFIIPDAPKIAVFCKKDVSDFIGAVLKSGENTKNSYYFSPEQISSVDFSEFDVIYAPASYFRESDFVRLQRYLEAGGSAMIFPGDISNGSNIAESMKSIGVDIGELKNFEKPVKFQSVDKLHPLFEGVFKGTTDEEAIVESPEIYNALPAKSGFPLIEMDGGYFLSEAQREKGRLLWLGVTPDLEWSTFPMTGIFFAIIYRSAAYLSARESFGRYIYAGDQIMLSLPKKYASGGNFRITDPAGNEFFARAAVLPAGAVISLDNLDEPGVYAVYSGNEDVISFIAVNTDPGESNLNILKNDEIEERLQPRLNEDTDIFFIEDSRNIAANLERARTGAELWQLFILAAVLAALAEMIAAKNSKAEAAEE